MKRIAVFSDTHNLFSRLPLALERLGKVDMLFHLGDFAIDAERISAELGDVPFFCVKGNNDSGSTYPRMRIERVKDVWIMLIHGDGFHTLHQLIDLARKNHCSAVLFGHTHMPLLQADGEVLVINPGSMSLPRMGKKPSCALLEVDAKDINVKMIQLI
jgi:putative phosphoesterase